MQGVEYASDPVAFEAELATRFGIGQGSDLAKQLLARALAVAAGTLDETADRGALRVPQESKNARPTLHTEWLQDALDETPAEPEWLWHGYIARGFTTLLVGLAKTGKTTLLCGLLQEFNKGGQLLGQRVVKGSGALILTEQNAAVFRSTIDNFGFGFDKQRVKVSFLHKQDSALEWDELIDDAIGVCLEHNIGLLIVDTFARWVSFEHDNDTPEILRAMRAADRAKSAGLAVLIVHHSRKAGGSHTEEVSGPVALAGGVDIVLSLRRAGERRALAADGRSMESPASITFGLKPHQGFTVAEEVDTPSLHALVLEALYDGPLTYAQLSTKTERSERGVRSAIYELLKAGEVVEAGKDARAKRYALAS